MLKGVTFKTLISNATIRKYYSKYGETMFGLDLNYFRNEIPDNLGRITKMKENRLFSINLKTGQIKQLNDSEKLAKDSLKILDNIENIIKDIKENSLNNAIMGPTLQDLSRETVMEYNIPPEDYMQSAVLHQEYPGRDKQYDDQDDHDDKQYDGHGGFHNRKNKTKNKKYTKKRTTYKTPKKRVSKKNKKRCKKLAYS